MAENRERSHLDFVVFVKQEALEGGFKQLEKEMFLFASDYTEREMKSKTSKSRNAAKVVRNTNANVFRTSQASNDAIRGTWGEERKRPDKQHCSMIRSRVQQNLE